jgi:predicted RNA binding protein YcfA (HicA-like mRNA interferase family)
VAKLPVVSGEETVKALERLGWRVARRASGSHIVLVKEGSIYSLSVPDHKELARGTLRKILRLANVSVDEFSRLL